MQLFLRGVVSLNILTAALGLAIRGDVLLPTDDPFYAQPANISNYEPGEIIAWRSVENEINGLLGASLTPISLNASYQYLYRTVDSFQNPIAAVTTVMVPYNADPSKLLSYQTAYDSANINCSPSYSLQAGADNVAVVDIVMLVAALDKGFYVVSSDYEGPSGALGSGLQAGYATLDSVRAALSETSTAVTGLSPAAKYALWGYSGGSIATEWAAELHPTYAPDLTNFQGAAAGGLIANLTNVILTINKGFFAGLGFAGVQGLANAYPAVASLVDASFVSADKAAEFRRLGAECLVPALATGAGHDFDDYFASGLDRLIDDEAVRAVLNETGQMGHTGVPTMPLYVYHAAGDEVAPVADADAVVAALCARGTVVEYRKNVVGEHATEDILGAAGALAWIEARLAGEPAVSVRRRTSNTVCNTKKVVVSTIGALQEEVGALGEEVVALLKDVLGGRLGG